MSAADGFGIILASHLELIPNMHINVAGFTHFDTCTSDLRTERVVLVENCRSGTARSYQRPHSIRCGAGPTKVPTAQAASYREIVIRRVLTIFRKRWRCDVQADATHWVRTPFAWRTLHAA